jgi:SlyX protein
LNESIRTLEEKIAYLERHVTQQDKAMLEFAEELAAIRRELKALHERAGVPGSANAVDGDEVPDERPPHY